MRSTDTLSAKRLSFIDRAVQGSLKRGDARGLTKYATACLGAYVAELAAMGGALIADARTAAEALQQKRGGARSRRLGAARRLATNTLPELVAVCSSASVTPASSAATARVPSTEKMLFLARWRRFWSPLPTDEMMILAKNCRERSLKPTATRRISWRCLRSTTSGLLWRSLRLVRASRALYFFQRSLAGGAARRRTLRSTRCDLQGSSLDCTSARV